MYMSCNGVFFKPVSRFPDKDVYYTSTCIQISLQGFVWSVLLPILVLLIMPSLKKKQALMELLHKDK